MTFIFTQGNYKADLSAHINELFGGELDVRLKQAKELRKAAYKMAQAGSMDPAEEIEEEPTYYDEVITQIIAEKNAAVERLAEAYFAVSGEMPDKSALERLSHWILRYMEHDTEYDVETKRQERHRMSDMREIPVDTVYNNEHTLKKDGNDVKKAHPSLGDEDEADDHSLYVTLDYDNAEDKRKYNASPVKNNGGKREQTTKS